MFQHFKRNVPLKRHWHKPAKQSESGEGPAFLSPTRGQLIWQADSLLREILLATEGEEVGAVCFTCQKWFRRCYIEVGHFIGRNCYFTRWNLANTRLQCQWCNRGKLGMTEIFGQRLDAETPGITDELNRLSRTPYAYTDDFFIQQIQLLNERKSQH